MKTKLILICTVAMLSSMLFGCIESVDSSELESMGDATSKLTCEMFQEQPHQTGDIVLDVGDTLKVILCSNRVTGFKWSESPEISDSDVLKKDDHEFVPPETNNIAGGAGEEIFIFKARKKGVSTIHFEYSRSWEGEEEAEWTFDLEVQIRE